MPSCWPRWNGGKTCCAQNPTDGEVPDGGPELFELVFLESKANQIPDRIAQPLEILPSQ